MENKRGLIPLAHSQLYSSCYYFGFVFIRQTTAGGIFFLSQEMKTETLIVLERDREVVGSDAGEAVCFNLG